MFRCTWYSKIKFIEQHLICVWDTIHIIQYEQLNEKKKDEDQQTAHSFSLDYIFSVS